MSKVTMTQQEFIQDPQGRTFADVVNDSEQPFDLVLEFFDDENRQRRMEESEIHHDRSPLTGVVRELESHAAVNAFLSAGSSRRAKRLRQAIGVLVRMIMERRGWRKTGRKGSLGVRATVAQGTDSPGAYHNTGGLAFWFLRAERYEREEGMPFRSVRERCKEYEVVSLDPSTAGKKEVGNEDNGRGRSMRSQERQPKAVDNVPHKVGKQDP